MSATEQVDRLLTIREAAAMLSMSRHYVYELYRGGQIEHIRLSRSQVRIRESEVRRFLASKTHPATADAQSA